MMIWKRIEYEIYKSAKFKVKIKRKVKRYQM